MQRVRNNTLAGLSIHAIMVWAGYEVANIGSCFDLKPDIERYQKLIKELDKALSDKK